MVDVISKILEWTSSATFPTIWAAIIGGSITFLIAIYGYNKNKPLDKLEIAYNRIYYPIYRFISDENMKENVDENIDEYINLVINKSKFYLNKYHKFTDPSTRRTFEYLCQCKTQPKKKSAYQDYIKNIYNRNYYLRRRLGYLEPTVFLKYNIASDFEKFMFRIICEGTLLFFFSYHLGRIQEESPEIKQIILLLICFVLDVIVIIELLNRFTRFLCYNAKKYFQKMKCKMMNWQKNKYN